MRVAPARHVSAESLTSARGAEPAPLRLALPAVQRQVAASTIDASERVEPGPEAPDSGDVDPEPPEPAVAEAPPVQRSIEPSAPEPAPPAVPAAPRRLGLGAPLPHRVDGPLPRDDRDGVGSPPTATPQVQRTLGAPLPSPGHPARSVQPGAPTPVAAERAAVRPDRGGVDRRTGAAGAGGPTADDPTAGRRHPISRADRPAATTARTESRRCPGGGRPPAGRCPAGRLPGAGSADGCPTGRRTGTAGRGPAAHAGPACAAGRGPGVGARDRTDRRSSGPVGSDSRRTHHATSGTVERCTSDRPRTRRPTTGCGVAPGPAGHSQPGGAARAAPASGHPSATGSEAADRDRDPPPGTPARRPAGTGTGPARVRAGHGDGDGARTGRVQRVRRPAGRRPGC